MFKNHLNPTIPPPDLNDIQKQPKIKAPLSKGETALGRMEKLVYDVGLFQMTQNLMFKESSGERAQKISQILKQIKKHSIGKSLLSY